MPPFKSRYTREGVSTLSQVSAFLGGLFFATLLILIQQGSRFQAVIFEKDFQNMTLQITQSQIIALPLAISIVLFVFSAFFFGIACSAPTEEQFDRYADAAGLPFVYGFISFFISLAIVLMLVDIFTGVIGILLAIGLTVWWVRKLEKINKQLRLSLSS